MESTRSSKPSCLDFSFLSQIPLFRSKKDVFGNFRGGWLSAFALIWYGLIVMDCRSELCDVVDVLINNLVELACQFKGTGRSKVYDGF